MTEEWRPIPGFLRYIVSDQGRVASLWTRSPRVLKVDSTGVHRYVRVSLRRDGQTYVRPVHQLVAEVFHGPRPDGMQVRHLDGDALNNAAINLAWGTASENAIDKIRHGTHPMVNKTRCVRGHAYTPENTMVDRRGFRSCRACRRRAQREYLTRSMFRAASVESAA